MDPDPDPVGPKRVDPMDPDPDPHPCLKDNKKLIFYMIDYRLK